VQYAERRGARFISLFSPDEMAQLLREAGFAEARPLTLEQARAAYFEGRSDGLDVEETERLIWARVSAVQPATA
jgi:O-methyltransferase involved in polyketide biosynthesis